MLLYFNLYSFLNTIVEEEEYVRVLAFVKLQLITTAQGRSLNNKERYSVKIMGQITPGQLLLTPFNGG